MSAIKGFAEAQRRYENMEPAGSDYADWNDLSPSEQRDLCEEWLTYTDGWDIWDAHREMYPNTKLIQYCLKLDTFNSWLKEEKYIV